MELSTRSFLGEFLAEMELSGDGRAYAEGTFQGGIFLGRFLMEGKGKFFGIILKAIRDYINKN